MSANRARNTAPELALRRALWRAGLRGYRTSPRGVPGRPDVAFTRRKVAVFVHGCFWHGCPRHGGSPLSNAAFWRAKFARNRARDAAKVRALRRAGWRVVVVWDHDLARSTARVVARVRAALNIADPSRRRSARRPARNGRK